MISVPDEVLPVGENPYVPKKLFRNLLVMSMVYDLQLVQLKS